MPRDNKRGVGLAPFPRLPVDGGVRQRDSETAVFLNYICTRACEFIENAVSLSRCLTPLCELKNNGSICGDDLRATCGNVPIDPR